MRHLAGWAALALVMGLGLTGSQLLSAAYAQEAPRFAGAAEIQVGQDVQSSIAGLPGEVHQYRFFAIAGSEISARLTADSSGSLLADLRLARPGGAVLARGEAAGPAHVTTQKLDRFEFPYSGIFVLEVAPRSGSGAYRLQTKAFRARKRTGLHPTPGAEGTWRFDAPGGTVLGIRVRAPGRHARGAGPRISGLLAPDGTAIDLYTRTRGQAAVANDVILVESGTYTLLWENPGGASRLRFRFSLRSISKASRGLFFPTPVAIAPGAPEVGESVLAARTGYVGSATCGRCHDQIYTDWMQTTHHLGAREWQRGGLTGLSMVNDANGNGRDDFRDGRNLAGDAAFAAIADAPTLAYVAGDALPYKATIGGVTYSIAATAGGNGIHQQSYLAKIGDALYPLPFEYDELRRAYAPLDGDLWYSGGAALYASAAAVSPDVSYEARCAGCHATGLVIEARAGGEIVGGHAEPGVGCEQCHGPGAAHAASGESALIQNPANLLDGSAAGVAAANQVCSRCHDRGDALETLAGTTVRPSFGYTQAGGVAQFGDDAASTRLLAADPDDFWGYKINPVFAVPGDTFAASKRRYLQGSEIARGSHAPDVGFAPTCFECHSPHRRAQKAMLATSIDRGVRVSTRLDDNTLCLSCHATHGPFENVPKDDVSDIARGLVPASVVTSVTNHMRDIGMGVPTFLYDPTGSGVGRCDTCHMPRTAGGEGFGTDAAGHALGDRASHEFRVVWPRASELYGVTNSCSGCHPTAGDDPVQRIIEDWARPDADGDSTFHSDTPRAFQNGVKNPDNNVGGLPCVQCHTTEGFVRIQVRGEETTQDDWNVMLKNAIAHDEGITCAACHGSDSNGDFDPTTNNPLRFPAKELCGRCHNDETIKFGDFRDDGEIVRHPQREMLFGTAGSESPGTGGYSDSAHSIDDLFPRGCADCHLDFGADGSHDFKPRIQTCQKCHGTQVTTFDRPANGDYDGDGFVEGIQSEVDGLLVVLSSALAAQPNVTFAGDTFNYLGATDGKMTGATDGQKRAAFNYYSVVGDASRGVHNAVRTVQLLQRSYLEITGGTVPGATLR